MVIYVNVSLLRSAPIIDGIDIYKILVQRERQRYIFILFYNKPL